jgi:hypothetical protein
MADAKGLAALEDTHRPAAPPAGPRLMLRMTTYRHIVRSCNPILKACHCLPQQDRIIYQY